RADERRAEAAGGEHPPPLAHDLPAPRERGAAVLPERREPGPRHRGEGEGAGGAARGAVALLEEADALDGPLVEEAGAPDEVDRDPAHGAPLLDLDPRAAPGLEAPLADRLDLGRDELLGQRLRRLGRVLLRVLLDGARDVAAPPAAERVDDD